jgi:hypothetical protein
MLPTAEIKLTSYNANVYEPSDVRSSYSRFDEHAPPACSSKLHGPTCMANVPPQDSFLLVDALQAHAAQWETSRPAL